MEDGNPQLISPPPLNNNDNKTGTTSSHFLYKAIFFSISLLLLPLFSSSSDFMINTTTTASWGELLQLVFVGIAVSYGLFSTKRNHVPPPHDDTHKQETLSDAQSYVARLFQVSSSSSSLFDDDHDDDFEIKTPFPSASLSSKEDNTTSKSSTSSSKVWNSQYYRGEPIAVVANKESSSSVIDEDKKTPIVVGSLTSRLVSKVDRSNSRSKLLLLSPEEEKEEENIGVLRSPVPWRSRSGRNMEVNTPAAASPSNPVVPPPPSVLETRSKSFQDFGSSSRKKITSPPIPPPPPPPPPPLQLNRINRKEFTRNYDLQNSSRGTRRGTSLSKSSLFRTPNQTQQQQDEGDNYLSHDHEIESFIETKGGGKFIIDEQKFIPNPKQPQQDDKKKKEITDTEESNSEYDDDDDAEDDELHELASKTSNGNGGEIAGPDVDKKADEFIAKFREQIRLQRIASIRTSTQIHKNNIY